MAIVQVPSAISENGDGDIFSTDNYLALFDIAVCYAKLNIITESLVLRYIAMVNKIPDEQQTFLVEVLQATSKSQGDRQVVYPLLRSHLDKLHHSFAQRLRKWVIAQCSTLEPARAIKIARIIVKFSNLVQEFEQGSKASNLEIAIAGYEATLQVFTREAFPQDWTSTQQALASAYQQRQHILDRTLAELRQDTVETKARIKAITDPLQQELLQTRQQVQELTKAIARLEQAAINPAPATNLDPLVSAIKELQSSHQQFNTAILYDIENLIMGNRNPVFNFSLKEITKQIKKIAKVEKIALQCAYANWSDARLRRMRNEIVELGIEPIQIFGFHPQKNAADIQLAIDAMELAHSRPALQVFVIVSGDGAFASLAKKLHEYGKTVIGCAYKNHANSIFEAVCDRFILIPEPELKSFEEQFPSIETSESNSDTSLIAITKQTLQLLKKDIRLEKGGIVIPQVRNFLSENIENFEKLYASYTESVIDKRLTSFLRIVCADTEFELDQNHPGKLVLKNFNTIEQGNVHSEDNYRQILMSGHKKFKLEHSKDIKAVAHALIENPLDGEMIAEATKRLAAMMGERVSQETIQTSLLAFLSADCFEIESENGAPWKRICTLQPHIQSEDDLLQALGDGVRRRLKEVLTDIGEEVDENVLGKIIS